MAEKDSNTNGTTEEEIKEQRVTPWTATAGSEATFDYQRLIKQFGTTPVDEKLIEKYERITGEKAHHLIRRNVFFSHRSLDEILDLYEKKQPFYLYTGRGPSSQSMHLGHLIPFMFTKHLQDIFDVPLVIQLTDDEKFLWRDLSLEEAHQMAIENAKEIIAVGFDIKKTFIFTDLNYISQSRDFLSNVLKIQKCVNLNQAKKVFGFEDTDNIGKVGYPAVQAATAFSNSFPFIFGGRSDVPCLIPCAIDQDPFFRVTRDVAPRLGYQKPSTFYSSFFPGLEGPGSKMSASVPTSSIFLSDSAKTIKDKINKHAFSGGKDNAEEHRRLGGDTKVDVSYQYLTFFLEDDEALAKIKKDYESGELLTGFLKKELIGILQKIVKDIQDRKAKITDEMVQEYMKPRPLNFKFMSTQTKTK
eukprot:TRINITY_DN1228_c0_g1_i1.p1 TRINITY_DN1228_c0_g1~~TRINITY_DN1228_c0_g1_i1.p1  ORF type:complete len:415 (+),score=124.68 TRINITY_DN1228_c0_g1_i1:57-1301(+)